MLRIENNSKEILKLSHSILRIFLRIKRYFLSLSGDLNDLFESCHEADYTGCDLGVVKN